MDNKDVLEHFYNSEWQGNVRELENIIESTINFAEGDYITLKGLQYYSIFSQSSSVIKMSHTENTWFAFCNKNMRYLFPSFYDRSWFNRIRRNLHAVIDET